MHKWSCRNCCLFPILPSNTKESQGTTENACGPNIGTICAGEHWRWSADPTIWRETQRAGTDFSQEDDWCLSGWHCTRCWPITSKQKILLQIPGASLHTHKHVTQFQSSSVSYVGNCENLETFDLRPVITPQIMRCVCSLRGHLDATERSIISAAPPSLRGREHWLSFYWLGNNGGVIKCNYWKT